MKEKPATRTSREDWNKKAKESLTYIGLTISQNQYGYIWDSTDGPNAWKALADIYEKNNRATHIFLKRQFYRYQHDEMCPIADYIASITDLAAQLKLIKVTLSDKNIIDVLIFNLHESWGSIAASLTAATKALRLNDVTGVLLDEEGRKGGRDPDSGMMALVAK